MAHGTHSHSSDPQHVTLTSTQRSLIIVLAAAACVLATAVGIVGVQGYQQWVRQPLGAAVPTSPYARLGLPATWTPTPARPSDAATPTVAVTNAPRCGGPSTMQVLLIGSDTRGAGYTWGLSDVMRVARIDFSEPRLTLLDFPRDLWVQIPEIADNLKGQDHEKLNQAYLYGNPGDGFGYWDDPSAGPGLLARTLEVNFGVKTDHYMAVNMQTFVRMVDAVDGLDVTLPERIGGSHDPNLQKGLHHLDGAEALAVARNRAEGVFSRGEEQNLVLCALQKKLLSPSVVPHIPELISAFRGSVQTDLSPELMGQLACLATQLPRKNIAFYSFPEDLFTGTRVYDPVFEKDVFIWDADFQILRNYVTQFQAGTWPEQVGASRPSSAAICP
jgi:LCP family protein required for cell wall assembly